MKREYKGFYIEQSTECGYHLYHVVTGNLAGCLPTVKDAKDEIDAIHNDIRAYAKYAGCDRVDLTLKRGRWGYLNKGMKR